MDHKIPAPNRRLENIFHETNFKIPIMGPALSTCHRHRISMLISLFPQNFVSHTVLPLYSLIFTIRPPVVVPEDFLNIAIPKAPAASIIFMEVHQLA